MTRRRKGQFPGPVRGTEAGDKIEGNCQGVDCGALVRRGDRFTTLIGDVLVCGRCHETSNRVKMPKE